MHVAQWAGVKPAERALEKLVRSYDLDPSRLLDTCRESLVYDHPAEIVAALDAIAADGELAVVRIKNRLESTPDESSESHARARPMPNAALLRTLFTLALPQPTPYRPHAHPSISLSDHCLARAGRGGRCHGHQEQARPLLRRRSLCRPQA